MDSQPITEAIPMIMSSLSEPFLLEVFSFPCPPGRLLRPHERASKPSCDGHLKILMKC